MEASDFAEAVSRATAAGTAPVARFALDGSIVALSDAMLAMLGYTREEFDAGDIDFDELTPRQYWSLDEYLLGQLASGAAGDPYVKEITRKDGSRIPVRVFCARNAGTPNEAVAVFVELVERRSASDKS